MILPGPLESEFGSTASAGDCFIDDLVLDKSRDFSVNSVGMFFDLVSVFVGRRRGDRQSFAHLITPATGHVMI